MKRVCAWCGLDLDQADQREDRPVTHGICPACRHELFTKKADSPPPEKIGDDARQSAAARRDPEGSGSA
jgi:hypothetical protein